MMNVIQKTLSGFTRSASRRMDTELCIVTLCQPELEMDSDAIIARLTKLEDQVRSGAVIAAAPEQVILDAPKAVPQVEDVVVVPQGAVEETKVHEDEAPVGFWMDVADAVRKELKPPVSGFFTTTQNSPVRGVLYGNTLQLVCTNQFTLDIINKQDVLSLIARKAAAKLGRQVRISLLNQESGTEKSAQLEQLLDFGRAHSDIIKIKDN